MAFHALKGLSLPNAFLKVPNYSPTQCTQKLRSFSCLSAATKSSGRSALSDWVSWITPNQRLLVTSTSRIPNRTFTHHSKPSVLCKRRTVLRKLSQNDKNVFKTFIRFVGSNTAKQTAAKVAKKPSVKNTDIKELFALAKPEKWKLVGKLIISI